MQYKNFTIRTVQDTLGHWTAFIDDAAGDTVAQVPKPGEYGKSTAAEAVTLAKRIIVLCSYIKESTGN